jgi:hypothetical protein
VEYKEVKTGWSNSRQIWQNLLRKAMDSKRAVLLMMMMRMMMMMKRNNILQLLSLSFPFSD